jgi:hypothetical protein
MTAIHNAQALAASISFLVGLPVPAIWADMNINPAPAHLASTAGDVRFVDVTSAAGVVYLQNRTRVWCIFGPYCEIDRMTGGAAVADVDGDGAVDLYVTRLDGPDVLFRNRGDGTFEDITHYAGLAFLDLQSNGAAFADIDNDGDPDLVVSVVGRGRDPVNNRNYFLINDGTGHFGEEGVLRSIAVASEKPRRGYGVTFGDYDRDGWLDIHTTEWNPERPSHSRLLRNRGSLMPGYFEDVTVRSGVQLDNVHGFASAFVDFDQDGWPDLAVVGDFGTSRLFWNNGDGTFGDGTQATGVATEENGMGSTIGDFDGDGHVDWFVTSIYETDPSCVQGAEGPYDACNWGPSGNRLYRYKGGRTFADWTDAADVRDGGWGWGAAFFDYDNDGDLDLVMTSGIVFPDSSVADAFDDEGMRLWENDGTGRMVEVSRERGLTDTGSGKGLLVFDYDDDGDLDLFVVNNSGEPKLYRNDGGSRNGWLRVRAVGTISNRDGLGAHVIVQSETGACQVREIGSVSHFLGQSERVAHFGLGPGTGPVPRVVVWWPSGLAQEFAEVARNTTLVAVEPAARGCTEGICADTQPPSFESIEGCKRAKTPSSTPEIVVEPPSPTLSPTAIPSGQTPTIEPTASATHTIPTPQPNKAEGCVGDCNSDGSVTVDEILLAVNVALDGRATSECPAVDSDGSGSVSVSEIVQVIIKAVYGCSIN